MRYEVVESKRWEHSDGRKASVFGAAPWGYGSRDGWTLKTVGWTVRDNVKATVGMCRPPYKTYEEAQTFVGTLNKPEVSDSDVYAWGAYCSKCAFTTETEYDSCGDPCPVPGCTGLLCT